MSPLTPILVYLLIGSVLAHKRWADIAVDADGTDRIITAAKWVLTWPAWAFQRRR